MSSPVGANSVAPLRDAKQYTTLSADIALTSAAESAEKHVARWIRVESVTSASATLVLLLGEGRATSRSFVVDTHWELIAEIVGIVASGTANVARLTVGW